MATVHLGASLCRAYCGDVRELEIDAATIGQLVRALDKRFPGLGEQIIESMALAIDGEIFQDSLIDPIGPDSEVHLIPKIGGG
jgi:sulfur-carrier protein